MKSCVGIILLLSVTFCYSSQQDSLENGPNKTASNKVKIVSSVGIMAGCSMTRVTISGMANFSLAYSTNPYIAVYAKLLEMKFMSQSLECFYLNPSDGMDRTSMANVAYLIDVHPNWHLIVPSLFLGPLLGINSGGNYAQGGVPTKFIKTFCFGYKWGLGMTLVKWKVQPTIMLSRYNYLTPIYQSENEGTFHKVSQIVDGYVLACGLGYAF
jgi:hypothetical protein